MEDADPKLLEDTVKEDDGIDQSSNTLSSDTAGNYEADVGDQRVLELGTRKDCTVENHSVSH